MASYTTGNNEASAAIPRIANNQSRMATVPWDVSDVNYSVSYTSGSSFDRERQDAIVHRHYETHKERLVPCGKCGRYFHPRLIQPHEVNCKARRLSEMKLSRRSYAGTRVSTPMSEVKTLGRFNNASTSTGSSGSGQRRVRMSSMRQSNGNYGVF